MATQSEIESLIAELRALLEKGGDVSWTVQTRSCKPPSSQAASGWEHRPTRDVTVKVRIKGIPLQQPEDGGETASVSFRLTEEQAAEIQKGLEAQLPASKGDVTLNFNGFDLDMQSRGN